ncbi:toll/interleukin-1 receptor domain-containing protein [Clostridium butyricum]|uniref:toll/interleukin-1 receptor domain-containing protein n=1 Tax=Clostridium butyricum TaxID=1492 RepID=UPI0034674659
MGIPKVFISYSWDNDLHKDWIVMLTNNLRKHGIDANFDRGVTQKGTINLNRMMIENLRDNDFIIVVMTKNYKERAEGYKGGVGLETMLLGNEILSDTKKVIPLKRDQGLDNEIVPYYLNGLNYTDFSQDSRFEESFTELLYRILKVDQLELEPIGELPNLKPKKIEYKPNNNLNNMVPNLKFITDIDKNNFLKQSFMEIKNNLISLSELTKKQNINFDYSLEEHEKYRYSLEFYLNGQNKTNIMLWISNAFGGTSILVSEGRFLNYSSGGTSCNEMIQVEVKDNELLLKTMLSQGMNKNGVEEITKKLWDKILVYLI